MRTPQHPRGTQSGGGEKQDGLLRSVSLRGELRFEKSPFAGPMDSPKGQKLSLWTLTKHGPNKLKVTRLRPPNHFGPVSFFQKMGSENNADTEVVVVFSP